MSTSTLEQEQTQKALGGGDRRIWHNPLTLADLAASLAGEQWTAMCGHRCGGSKGEIRHVTQLAPMQRCQVCKDLVDAGQRIAL